MQFLLFYTAERHTRNDIFGQKQIYQNDRNDSDQNHGIDLAHIKVHIVRAPERRDQNRDGHLLL